MVEQTPYTFENLFTPFDATADVGKLPRYHAEDALPVFLGKAIVLKFEQDDSYEGDWSAFVTDGHRIGLVEGAFGSCSGCDWLEACDTVGDFVGWGSEHLKAVRTFVSWDDVLAYFATLDADQAWAFRGVRKPLAEFAKVDLPLGAADIFLTLLTDNPHAGPVQAAQLARQLQT